ncbi:MAG: 3-oxoacyl-ACP synthase [Desulfuromonas sp.]|nr:MAG: 3-oxoacyl-ACP synthase [Desulfuromonas sp.]
MNQRPLAMILGTGCATPEKILTNADLEKIVDTSDEWITTRTGIRQRHVAEPGKPLSELATEAARQALENAGVKAEEIDLIIVGTVTGDMKFPATACLIQQQLGAKQAAAFDLSAACSGFLYGLQVAEGLMAVNGYQRILLIGGEVLTSMVNWQDRDTCVLFGDGAGAVVLGPAQDGRGVLYANMFCDGNHSRLLYNAGGGSLNPPSAENIASGIHAIKMEGQEVFRHAVVSMCTALKKALKQTGLTIEDIDLLIPHQANLRIIEAVGKRFKLPEEKVFVNVDRYGNTSAASIPIALDEVLRSGRVESGALVAMVTFGAGFTWAASIIRI